MVENEPIFFPYVNIIDLKLPISQSNSIMTPFLKIFKSKFMVFNSFSLCQTLGMFFHSLSLLKVNLATIFNNFKYYAVICDLRPCCEEIF